MGTVNTGTERAARAVATLGELLKDHQCFVTTFPRGPTDRALTGFGWDFIRKEYKGFDQSDLGPLSVFKAVQNGVGNMAVVRVVGSNAYRASLALLDHRGKQSVMLLGRWVADLSTVTVKNIRAQALSLASSTSANTAGTVTSAKRALCVDSPGKFEIGDVCYATDGTNIALFTIYGINGTTGDLLFTAPVMLVGTTVAAGALVYTTSKHLLQTRLATTIAPGSTSAVLDSASGAYKGQEIVVQKDSDDTVTPIELVITGVNGRTITFAAPGGTDSFVAGSRVSSIEGILEVTEPGLKTEEYVYSLSETFAERYINNILGQSFSWTFGSSLGALDTGQAIADNATTVNVATGVWDALVAGDVIRFTESSNNLIRQVKSKSGTKTLQFDDVGDITAFTAAATVHKGTATIVQGRKNESRFVLGAEMNYGGGVNSATSERRYRLPRPVDGVALTGGAAGDAPTGLSQCLGSSVEGSETGAYLLDKLPEKGRIDGVWAPGLDADDTEDRAAIDDAYQDFVSSRKMTFGSSHPSTITTGERLKTYINDDLGIDSSYEALYGSWVGIDHPELLGVVAEIPPDGFAAGIWSRRARRGIHVPPGNERLIGVKYLVTEVKDEMAKTLENLGCNLIRHMGARGYVLTTTRTLYRNASDGTKRDHLNVRRWLNSYERALEEGLQPLLEEVGNENFFDEARLPVEGYLENEFNKGVFSQLSQSDSYYVQFDKTTTTSAGMAAGDFVGVTHVSPAGAVRSITIETVIHEGSVRVREAA